jgi:hypothetical protein
MSVVAPSQPATITLSPTVRARPQPVLHHTRPDWVPTIGWFVEDGWRHTRVSVIPLANTVNPEERFVTRLKFFRGSDEPLYSYTSETFWGDTSLRFEGSQLLQALGESTFEGLVEITARSLDNAPEHFPWVESWLEFYADDGRFSGSVPGFVFKGGTTKRVMSGKWQHWPGIVENSDYQSSVLLLNYHPRPTEARLDLFAPSGRCVSSSALTLAPRMPATFALEDCVPGAGELLASEGGIGSLRIWSAYKAPGFVMMRNRASGVVTSFDHTVPFAGPPIE